MKITSDPTKRQWTLENRGLDLEVDSAEAFAGRTLTLLTTGSITAKSGIKPTARSGAGW